MSDKKSETTSNSIAKTRLFHKRYLMAVNSPLRRRILSVLKKGAVTVEELQSMTGLDMDTLKWHLGILERGFCVEKEVSRGRLTYRLSREGRVIDYLE